MIIHPAEQGSKEWTSARLGIPTASQFKRIVTATGKLSESRDEYMGELLFEHFFQMPYEDFMGNEWTERGTQLEPEAFNAYAVLRDVEPVKVGLCYRDESRTIGASPDGLVGDDGCLELKCPGPAKHLVQLGRSQVPQAYWMQVQGQIWVTGRKWCDYVSYFPGLPIFVDRVLPEPDIQAALDKLIPWFVDELVMRRTDLEHMGVRDMAQQVTAGVASPDGVTVGSRSAPDAAGESPAGRPPNDLMEAAVAAFGRRE